MSTIVDVRGREIIDSRGNPTVEAEVTLESGVLGRAAVPSGASTGAHEAVELRDSDHERFLGRGVLKAVSNVNERIADVVRGFEVREQVDIDQAMIDLDGTPNKQELGANSILAVSMAVARAAAAESQLPLWRYLATSEDVGTLPVPMMNILNGGSHAPNNVDIQEFMVMPVGAATFSEGLRMGVEIFHHLKNVLSAQGRNTAVGDEGGFAPDLANNEEAIEVVLEAIEKACYPTGRDVVLTLDAADAQIFQDGHYVFHWSGGERRDSNEMVEFWRQWVAKYPISSIEDPLDENDWDGWTALTEAIGSDVQIVGDDLFVTDADRLEKGIRGRAANAIPVSYTHLTLPTKA